MTKKTTVPYGSWKSPITSDLIASGTISLGQIILDGEDIYWLESHPIEGGRYVVMRRSPDGRITEMTASPFNARTRVHEYGGGSFLVVNGTVYFSNFTDQRIYRQDSDSGPQPLTPEANLRYADGVIDHRRQRIICVCEDHTDSGSEPVNTLVSINLDDGGRTILVSGNDFYSSPRLSPDGSKLAWLTWNHPNMPWDGTELWVGEIKEDGSLGNTELVAGSENKSIFQPEYSPDGTLYFVSDRSGWWNLYHRREGRIESLCQMEAEFGVPYWVFGCSTYAFESANRIICSYTRQGTWYLASLDLSTGAFKAIETPYTSIEYLRASPGRAVFLAGSSTEPTSVVYLDLNTDEFEVLRLSSQIEIDPEYLSVPAVIEFPTEHELTAHAFFYVPKNGDFLALPDERPPLIVISHGGPTSATSSTLNLGIQYWTSRGIAVVDVNYGGSTGYGRAYRQRLDNQWGIVDVDDCVNSTRYLIERGEVDGNRLMIRGGSAGGYTTLAALTFRDVFKAGASYYGVSDPAALARDTHKFESRYLDRLIAPYPARSDLYWERSPIDHVEQLSCPLIFFQGNEDKVVPPEQAELMVNALRQKGVPVAYILFEGEQHGFRRAENIKRALDAELYFYSRIFGFNLPEPVEPVPIDNLA
jgi:dipeptidyl aminopeptidase/acylaminoacyl peptidase